MPGSDRCAATRPYRAQQTAKASDAGTEAGAVPPAVSDRRRGQGCRAARRIGADSVFFAKEARCIRKGGGKGGVAQGETGAAAGRTVWKSG